MSTPATSSSVVVIVSGADGALSLRKRLPAGAPVAVFADSEALHASDVVHASPPKILLLDSHFVRTPRGAALVADVRDTRHLTTTEVRVLTRDDLELDTPSYLATLLKGSRAIDQWGTRAVPRFAVRGEMSAIVNGQPSELVDVSTGGAQVVAPVRLAPGQPVRLVIADQEGEIRCRGQVAWCVVVPAEGLMKHRAGVAFQQADVEALEALCLRHGHRM
jgi:PilZ domain